MLEVAVIGLGYFSQFHLRAWGSCAGAALVAACDQDPERVAEATALHGVVGYRDVEQMLTEVDPDMLDLIVPPAAQAALIRAALRPGRTIICQKPFCTSLAEAEAVTAEAEAAGAQLVIHENFRFQPWHRAAKDFLDSGAMGEVYSARFALRPGDGRGPEAYMARQPSFQTMPRFLVQETAVHLMDVMRWLFGPVRSVYADLRRLNPAIAGEDAGVILMTHGGGAQSSVDGNRLADHVADDPRRTMGVMCIEGEGGTLTLDGDGGLWFRAFGTANAGPVAIRQPIDTTQFGGGCVEALIRHVVTAVAEGHAPENLARDYLEVLRLVEAAYQSDAEGRKIVL